MPAKYHLWISGCQMNSSDARELADSLDRAGMTPVDRFEDADATILYTCSVRQSAESRVHGQLGHLKAIKARRPEMVLCVTGCMAGADPAELHSRYPHVDLFVGPIEAERLPDMIVAAVRSPESCAPLETSFGTQVPGSLGLTAIRGCDKYCTYCIVPYRRGPQKSRRLAEIVEEATLLVARGAREIVLLGQTVDSWGRDLEPKQGFGSLLRAVAAVPGLLRLRFVTSHPEDFGREVIQAMVELPPVCEEVNLPIQAGDDDVLRRMARRYTAGDYLRLVEDLRAAVPGVALSTDLIVGFPGETEQQFERSIAVLRGIQFDTVHVAAYSPRPGTAAARKLVDGVPPEEKKRRLHEVEGLQTEISTRKNASLVGKTLEVLVERREKGKWSGRTRTNKLVFFESDRELAGEMVQVAIEGAGAWSLRGSVLSR